MGASGRQAGLGEQITVLISDLSARSLSAGELHHQEPFYDHKHSLILLPSVQWRPWRLDTLIWLTRYQEVNTNIRLFYEPLYFNNLPVGVSNWFRLAVLGNLAFIKVTGEYRSARKDEVKSRFWSSRLTAEALLLVQCSFPNQTTADLLTWI